METVLQLATREFIGIKIWVWVLVAVFGIPALVSFAKKQKKIETVKAPLRGHVEGFLDMSVVSSNTDRPYLVPRVIVLDRDKRNIHDLTCELPQDLVPIRPEDIGTVVWLETEKDFVGTYTSGKAAFRLNWKLTLIDVRKSSQIVQRKFIGGPPPKVVRDQDHDAYGS